MRPTTISTSRTIPSQLHLPKPVVAPNPTKSYLFTAQTVRSNFPKRQISASTVVKSKKKKYQFMRRREPLFPDQNFISIDKEYLKNLLQADGELHNDIMALIRRCSRINFLKYVPIDDDTLDPIQIVSTKRKKKVEVKHDNTIIDDLQNDKKVVEMEKIYNIITNSEFMSKINRETVDLLFKMILINTDRPKKSIPNIYFNGDRIVHFRVNYMNRLECTYHLFSTLVKTINRMTLMEIFNTKFMNKFLLLLNTPDKNEQKLIASLIVNVFDYVPSTHRMIFKALTSKIKQYIDGEIQHHSVVPCLTALNVFFSRANENVLNQFVSIFKTCILPLFTTQFLSEFITELNDICIPFYSHCTQIPEYSLRRLIRYWPITNSTKQILFLNHFPILMNYFPLYTQNILVLYLFNKINLCLISLNYQVSYTALNLINDQEFISRFEGYFSSIIPPIINSLREMDPTQNPNPDTVSLYNSVVKVLAPINSRLIQPVPVKSKNTIIEEDKIAKNKWKLLAQYSLDRYGTDVHIPDTLLKI